MKYQNWQIKPKPFFWQFLPWLSAYTAQAIYPNIYVSKKIYENLQTKNPKIKYLAALEHEKKHLERQRKMGLIKFGLKYLFFPSFRLQEELIAIQAGMKYFKSKGLNWDIDRSAKFLSSWLYLWMVSQKRAQKELQKLWASI
jgi:hypothetical protein